MGLLRVKSSKGCVEAEKKELSEPNLDGNYDTVCHWKVFPNRQSLINPYKHLALVI